MNVPFCGFADEAGQTLSEQIAATKALGWSGLELRMLEGKNFCDVDDATFYKAHETLMAEDLRIVGLGSQIANWARPITSDFQKDVDELKRNIPRMHKVGTKLIRIMSYPNVKDAPWPEAEWKREVFRRLHKLARIAQDGGVILAHENCSGYGGIGPKQTLEMLAEVNSPALKLIMDTGNTTLHDSDHEATWRHYSQTVEHILHVHVKAFKPDANGKWNACFPDEDPVQTRIFADLKKRNYSGWVSIEPHLAAVVHENKAASDSASATRIFVEYGQRLERLFQQA